MCAQGIRRTPTGSSMHTSHSASAIPVASRAAPASSGPLRGALAWGRPRAPAREGAPAPAPRTSSHGGAARSVAVYDQHGASSLRLLSARPGAAADAAGGDAGRARAGAAPARWWHRFQLRPFGSMGARSCTAEPAARHVADRVPQHSAQVVVAAPQRQLRTSRRCHDRAARGGWAVQCGCSTACRGPAATAATTCCIELTGDFEPPGQAAAIEQLAPPKAEAGTRHSWRRRLAGCRHNGGRRAGCRRTAAAAASRRRLAPA